MCQYILSTGYIVDTALSDKWVSKPTLVTQKCTCLYLEPELVAFEINHPVFIRLAPCFEKKHETWGNPDLINIQSSPSTVGIKVIFLVCIGRNQSSPCHGKIGSVRIKPTSEKHKEPRWGRRSSLRVRWKMIKCHLIISKRDDVTEVSLK